MLHAVIMAGGSGTRFWPLSRAAVPKQLLQLVGSQTMIQATVDRLGELVPPERVWIITARRLAAQMVEQLPSLPARAIVGEPCRRDTAPCVGLAAVLALHEDPEATLVVMPADHVIQPAEAFRQALSEAAQVVNARPGSLVTFGIPPTFPAETYGYIQRGESLSGPGMPLGTFQVAQFKEKPKAELARGWLEQGGFYWNAGIFVWRATTILDALAEFEPEMHARLLAIGEAIGRDDYDQVLEREFSAAPAKSIDYAVLEHHRDRLVIEANFDWDDVGTWQSLERLVGRDADGNTVVGSHVGLNTTGSIIRSDGGHLIATLGLKDCIVVHTPDATLVANKQDEESLRKLVQLLEERYL